MEIFYMNLRISIARGLFIESRRIRFGIPDLVLEFESI